MSKKILVVVAHPDDEVLGVGGTIARHAGQGDEVSVLILADGEASRDTFEQDDVQERQSAAHKAAEVLGIKNLFLSDFPDNQMDTVPMLDIVKVVEQHIRDVKPDVIYTHHGGDLNVDHRLTFEAVMTASRPIEGNPYPKQIFCFETLSSTEWGVHKDFKPDTYVDIEAQFETKRKALECYDNEMRDFPHPRSYKAVEALAALRGSVVALKAAEAFECVRNIVD